MYGASSMKKRRRNKLRVSVRGPAKGNREGPVYSENNSFLSPGAALQTQIGFSESVAYATEGKADVGYIVSKRRKEEMI